MGGSGGGGSFFPSYNSKLADKLAKAKEEADRDRINSQVNKLIRAVIPQSERDVDKTSEYLDQIKGVLKEESDMRDFLFGGSVAKHTYVDGLSDIDALVILKKEGLGEEKPAKVLREFKKNLDNSLSSWQLQGISRGQLAVTVKYDDGTEIQLLPAIKKGPDILISNSKGDNWIAINPKKFQMALTRANQRLNNSLIPTIKLAKSIISDFPKQLQLSGYHTEALAIDAVEGYAGGKTIKNLLENFFSIASKKVLTPLADATGQSKSVDEYLGGKNSQDRIAISKKLEQVANRMQRARTLTEWERILGIE